MAAQGVRQRRGRLGQLGLRKGWNSAGSAQVLVLVLGQGLHRGWDRDWGGTGAGPGLHRG